MEEGAGLAPAFALPAYGGRSDVLVTLDGLLADHAHVLVVFLRHMA